MYSSQSVIAANRFGYGGNYQTIHNIAGEPLPWLMKQLLPESISQQISLIPPIWSSRDALRNVYLYRKQKKSSKTGEQNQSTMVDGEGVSRKGIIKQSTKLIHASIRQAINSNAPFLWHLVDFFSNHFSVSGGNLLTKALAPTLEIEAIAPHLSERFVDMLLAVQQHPAMLYYLNNVGSAGPNSKAAKKRQGRGLNENLAREILELHTLGVKGGYSQTDVTELAKSIAGWSVGSIKRREPAGFKFRRYAHEPGVRKVMGKTYSSAGVLQGEAILTDLANHVETAKHISTKLVKHFISDDPPSQIIDAMVSKWQKSDGNISQVIQAMVSHPLSWEEHGAKFKTPREFVISTCRSCGIDNIRPNFTRSLAILGQAPFSAGSPAGYKDTRDYWAGPRAMMSRIEWAEHVSRFVTQSPLDLSAQALGPLLSENTKLQIKGAESKRQGVTLMLMSPEFQKR